MRRAKNVGKFAWGGFGRAHSFVFRPRRLPRALLDASWGQLGPILAQLGPNLSSFWNPFEHICRVRGDAVFFLASGCHSAAFWPCVVLGGFSSPQGRTSKKQCKNYWFFVFCRLVMNAWLLQLHLKRRAGTFTTQALRSSKIVVFE